MMKNITGFNIVVAQPVLSSSLSHGESEKLSSTANYNQNITYSIQVEQSLLGCLLLENHLVERVNEFLKSDYFALPLHQEIYRLILTRTENNQISDPITLKPILENHEGLKDMGGITYLGELTESVISLSSVHDYGKMVHDFYLRRQLNLIGDETVYSAKDFSTDEPVIQKIEHAEKKLYDLATHGQFGQTVVSFETALTQAIHSAEIAYKRDSHVVGVTTGFTKVDEWMGGMHPSDLIIVAGRPSMGKTVFGTNIAFNAAKTYLLKKNEGAPAAFFSLEMSAEQLATRILSSETGVSSDKIRRGEISKEDFPKFIDVSREIGKVGLFIDDTPALTVTALRNRARRLKRQHNIGIIVIDYLQLLEGDGGKNSDNRVQEISQISRSLKALAKELNIPVIAMSQLSRAVEQRDDKRPQLSDLRESGSIEQDADVVMFIYREEYYVARKRPTENTEKYMEWQRLMSEVQNKAEIIIAKQRHGPVGTIKLYFDGRTTKFANLAEV